MATYELMLCVCVVIEVSGLFVVCCLWLVSSSLLVVVLWLWFCLFQVCQHLFT